jgi:ribokinase
MTGAGRVAVVGSYAVGLTLRTDTFPVAGETRLGSGFEQGPGGKGSNQAIGVARLGGAVSFIGCIGNDDFGRAAVELLDREGVDVSAVAVMAGETTGVGFIVLDAAGNNVIVLDPGANRQLDATKVRRHAALLAGSDVVITQLEIPEEAAAAALEAGRRGHARTILNPAPARALASATLGFVDVLTPNETELRVLSGLAPDAAADDARLAALLLERGVGAVIVTRGSAGALVVDRLGSRSIGAPVVEVIDSTGAGDAFNAALATSLASGDELYAAVELAVVAGALACMRAGVVPSLPSRAELEERLAITTGTARPA